MAPRFSVLLPTHDRADVVGYAIRSVLAQTETDLELLIAGDGCTDDTASVVGSFDDDRIRWFDLPKAPDFGYANRNLVLREARGDLIAFMAHDDLLLPDHLKLMGAAFERPGTEWAYSRPLWMDDAGVAVPFAVDLRRPDAYGVFMEVRNSIPASCVVHRRSCFDRYGWWPEEVSHAGDWVLWRRFIGPSGGANLAYLPTVTCIHFRASWRKPAAWGPSPLHEWLAASTTAWWPESLSLGIDSGDLPQAEVWKRLSADPAEVSRRLRDGVIDVIDGFAWASAEQQRDLQQLTARADTLEAHGNRQSQTLEELRHELAGAQATNETLFGSTSWRVTAPLRRLGRTMRRDRDDA